MKYKKDVLVKSRLTGKMGIILSDEVYWKVKFGKDKFEIVAENDLEKISRAANCFKCGRHLDEGDKFCYSCCWYRCPDCNSCGCDFI